jgi:adenylylsulfate kinase-like enzyme|tara:strand:- start:5190 stop:6047 length:858 start_codon:yes stop_codon:yes gene_type:complete
MENKKAPYWISPIAKEQLANIKTAVRKKDRDYVMVIDGEEGSGKSVLAQQYAKELDPKFNIDNICFNADQFIERLKKAPKYSCIILDEAFSSANSRSALTEVNRSLIGVATEMRQRNLFVIIVIPSFFDLDKYFALWRCRALFHVYFKKDGSRGSYIIFPKNKKKYLYLNGKKFYNYSKPASPYPVCSFSNYYTIDEIEYRKKKAEAFKKRVVSNLAKRWKLQRDALVKEMYHNKKVRSSQFEKIFLNWGAKPVSQREIQRLVQLFEGEDAEKDIEGDASSYEGD